VAAPFRIEPLRDPSDQVVHRMLVALGLEEQARYDHPLESAAELSARTGPVEPRFVGENIVLVARDPAGQPIGLCWCVLFDPGTGLEGEVAELFVDPAHRGQGVASALVGEARELFSARHVTFACVWTRDDNPAALAAYRRHGFAPTEQTVLTWLPLPDADNGARD
jgi:ribosomal protein S18 acetylase RimI-like enzyme